MFSGKDFWQTRSVERVGIKSIMLSDGPHGVRKQEGTGDQLGLNPSLPATCFPTAATIANSWDTSLGEEIGRMIGEEAASQGVSVILGPGMNIKRNPLCGRNFEYYPVGGFQTDPFFGGGAWDQTSAPHHPDGVPYAGKSRLWLFHPAFIPFTGNEPLSYGIFYRKNGVSPLLKKFISIMTTTSFQ